MAKPFFEITLNAVNRITEIFDLVHPISLSYWNMKASVLGTNELLPVSQTKYNERYNVANVVHGVNFKKSFIETSWDDFQNNLSWLLLNSLFSIYEGFLSDVKGLFSLTDSDVKQLQFPTVRNASGIPIKGFESVIINKLSTHESSIMKDCFYDKYKSLKHYPSVSVENLLYCYRYFKELRNCYVHNNIISTSKLVDAYNEYLPYEELLGIKKKLKISVPIEGKKAEAILYGVIGFAEIIFDLLYVIDAEMLKTQKGEDYFLDKIKQQKSRTSFNPIPVKAYHQVNNYCAASNFIHPAQPDKIKQLLIDKGIKKQLYN